MGRNKIAITTSSFGKYDPQPLALLKKNKYDLVLNPFGRQLTPQETKDTLQGCVGVVAGTESYTKDVIAGLKDLKVISRCGVGMDAVDLTACKKQKIKVFNTPDVPVLAVAELVMGLMLNMLRRLSVMDREMHQGIWKKRMGNMLSGKSVGILGFGRIGQAVGRLCRAFGSTIIYSDPIVKINKTGIKKVGFQTLLKKSDIIVLCLSYRTENKNLLGKNEFALMKKGALIVNCSRGGIIDEEVLYQALQDGNISGVALDVFEQEPYQGPLTGCEGALLTPHIGSYAVEKRIEMEIQAVTNLIKGLK